MMKRTIAILLLVWPLAGTALAQDAVTERRKRDLEHFLKTFPPSRTPATGRINAYDKTWEEWVRRTGELPPDFQSMPSIAGLPDPLLMQENGRTRQVRTPAEWEHQKKWLRSQIEQWMFGHMPPAPGNLRGVVTGTEKEGDVTIRHVRLEFGPEHRGTLRVELMIPPGPGPFPVFMTNHPRTRPWVATAVRRGYIGCIYYAADPYYGNDDDSDKFVELYPKYDFPVLARWAWAGMRAIDYLYTLPQVDKKKIGLAGHSRNGKQALLAAAFDERIGAVIPSSGNTGECDPWRYTTDMFSNESIQLLAGAQPHWFTPRLRFFAGREDKLPVDQHTLMALVAPRGCMMYTAYSESASNPFGYEQGYRAAKRVYDFLGSDNLWLHLRAGEHPTTAGDIENFIDFFDTVFKRKAYPKWETWTHGYTFADWRKLSGETIDPLKYPKREVGASLQSVTTPQAWDEKRKSLRRNLLWALGEEPAGLQFPARSELAGHAPMTDNGWLAGLFNRPTPRGPMEARLAKDGMGVSLIGFGDDLQGTLFYPLGEGGKPKSGKLPVVVWLHPYTYQNGWSAASPWSSSGGGYGADVRPSFPELVKRGFAVLAFDQLGFGTRVLDARKFYERYPKWSLMGKMVADTRAAIGAVAALDVIDPERVYLLGYALGAKVGLMTAALDDRVRGVASICGVDALRLSTPNKGTEGLGHYSDLHGLLPKLGFFAGNEARVPFDYDEVVALAAPRPALIVAPTKDRYARIADVQRELDAAGGVYRTLGHRLEVWTPDDFNRFPVRLQQQVYDWLAK
ncbi:MAG TPA: alpha/beta fold hydrolase, partial [Bryobacteraceae bacterium]|nr:alpha/beta fold hydrolase [Bryobacteraceae bacterium]